MKLQVSSDPPRDRGEAVNTQLRLPKWEVQRSNRDTHRQDACWTGVWCHSPRRKWGARTGPLIVGGNVLYVIQIMWRDDWVNDLINRKHVTQLTCQKYLNADLGVPCSASIWCITRRAEWCRQLGSQGVTQLLFTLYSQGFLSFLLLASPWSEATGGECSDPHRPRGDHVCTYYI